MHTFHTSDGRTLSYTTDGAGPLVVMLPGGPGIDPAAFYAHTALPGFRLLVFAPAGTGRTDPPKTPDGYRIAGYVDDVEELRRHLAVPQLTLYGSSHGASTALGYASQHPGRVQRMILAAGPARLDAAYAAGMANARARFTAAAPSGVDRLAASDEAGPKMRTATSDAARQAATRTMIDTYIAHPSTRTAQFLDELAAAPTNPTAVGPMAAEMTSGLDLLANATAINTPTLVLTGDLDVRVPTEHMQIIADTLPHAQLVRFPDIGHLIHIEDPHGWVATASAFLDASPVASLDDSAD